MSDAWWCHHVVIMMRWWGVTMLGCHHAVFVVGMKLGACDAMLGPAVADIVRPVVIDVRNAR